MTTLENDISVDIEERHQVLENVKTLPTRYGFNEVDKQFFRNYSVLIIYAVWEGFVQQSFQTYVRELNKLEIKKTDIQDKILIFVLENQFPQLHNYPGAKKQKEDRVKSGVINQKMKYFEGLTDFFLDEKIQIPVKDIDTESNVGFNVINHLLDTFNLEKLPDYLEPQYRLSTELKFFIDKHRNPIAHGNANAIKVSTEEITRFDKLVRTLMDEVFEKVKQGFKNKSYLK